MTSIGLSWPLRMMVSLILVLTGPRIFSTAWFRVRPCTCSSSSWVMMSLARMPALAAGVSSIGVTTLTRPSSIVTSMPRPPNSPRVCTCMSRKLFGVHVARMRIEPGEHAVDRRLDQLGVVRLLDVVGAHALEHVAEQIELPVGVGGRRLAPSSERTRRGWVASSVRAAPGSRTEEDQRSLAHHPRTFSLSLAAHQGLGSTGVPSFRNST